MAFSFLLRFTDLDCIFGIFKLIDRGLLLTMKLLSQWFLVVKLMSSLQKFYGRHHESVNGIFDMSPMTTDRLHLW
jgi:hypothetical protein